MNRALNSLKEFFHLESTGGVILVLAAIFGLVCANSDFAPVYHALLHSPIPLMMKESYRSVEWWINDGLMVIFFLLIGLEIKREMLEGELSTRAQAVLPAVGAAGGMLAPALIYCYFNWGNEVAMRGWAIPSATDIAFSLAVLAVVGSRVPLSLKVFLTAVAVFDDLGAIIIIALFYTDHLSLAYLAASLLCVAILFALGRYKPGKIPYILIGLLLWYCVLKSGVHATIAGVILGLLIPHKNTGDSMLLSWERALHPWVAFGILPLFAFANAGVSLEGININSFSDPIPLGIIAGLFVGKQLGIFGFVYATIKLGMAPMPKDANWLQLYSIAIIAGIGFTMSLFIGSLAFTGQDPIFMTDTRLGVMSGSLLSALAGYGLLRLATRK